MDLEFSDVVQLSVRPQTVNKETILD